MVRGHGWRTTETDFIQAGIQRIRGWRREAVGRGGGYVESSSVLYT
jgi:hypothetical protein